MAACAGRAAYAAVNFRQKGVTRFCSANTAPLRAGRATVAYLPAAFTRAAFRVWRHGELLHLQRKTILFLFLRVQKVGMKIFDAMRELRFSLLRRGGMPAARMPCIGTELPPPRHPARLREVAPGSQRGRVLLLALAGRHRAAVKRALAHGVICHSNRCFCVCVSFVVFIGTHRISVRVCISEKL